MTGRIVLAGLAAGAVGLSLSLAAAQPREQTVTVRAGKAAWVYSDARLLAIATERLPNLKGTRMKPAIGLDRLLARETGLDPGQMAMVVVIGEIVTLLRGPDLAHLDKLVLATGPDKGGRRHDWALAARDEKAYMALSPSIGSGRKHGIYRIDIILKSEP